MARKRQYCEHCNHRMTIHVVNEGSDIDERIREIALCHNVFCEYHTALCDHGQPWFLCDQCQQQRAIDTDDIPF